MKQFSLIASVLVTLAASLTAQAHVPFLKPNQFNVTHHRLTIESAFTEFPFQADFAMDSPNFTITTPNGVTTAIKPIAKTKAAVYLEPTLTEEGTYRISTGQRVGPIYKAVETADKKLYFAADMKRVTGKPTTMNYYSYADTYIFKGQQKYVAKPFNKGLEIIPVTSPNGLVLGGEGAFRVLEDGKPVANARIIVVTDNEHFIKHRIEDLYDLDNVRESNIHANQQGEFTFTPKKAGLNFLFVTVHHQLNENLWESQNASLTLEVNLPAEIQKNPDFRDSYSHFTGKHNIMPTTTFQLKGEFIALCDLLKLEGVADSGGQGKSMVAEGLISVDGQIERRKTAKIRAGQVVQAFEQTINVVAG